MTRRSTIYFLALLLSYHSMATAEHIEVSETDNGSIDVKCDGELFTSYLYRDTPKPVLYPIVGPTGHRMTRDYPLKEGTPGEATDHPHHQSLWFGHGDVNGTDFWLIGEGTGKIRHDRFGKLESGPIGLIEATSTWLTADGKEVCREQRTMRFAATDSMRTVDLEITLTASKEAAIFGDTKEGTMAIRTRPELRLTANRGGAQPVPAGHAINSNGDRDKQIWGKRAAWVDYWGEVEGDTVGIAILDHPDNLRHPTTWHARDYGLVAANPFGMHDFLNEPANAGAYRIAPGDSLVLRYRFVFHRGDANSADITSLYDSWAKGGFQP